MSKRAELSETLHGLCPNVYFQPTINTQITYPCIIYTLTTVNVDHADNEKYIKRREYSLQYIGTNPDPVIEDTGEDAIDAILNSFDHIRHVNRFTAKNLYHDNFILYY